MHGYAESRPAKSGHGSHPHRAGTRNVAQVLVALALLLPLVGCMSGGRKHSLPAPSDAASPLTSGDLHARLLDAAELGDGSSATKWTDPPDPSP